MSERSLLLVLSTPLPGREAEFDHWYDHTHIPQVSALPGWTSARRLRLHPARLSDQLPPSPYRCLTVWDIDGDPAAAFTAHDEALAAGRLDLTTAVDPSGVAAWTFQPLPGATR
ncbi:hypothetical protein ABZX85_30890 [Streptomyces sp. NPDC004539]|uniref:hypothetical protein n=1 Tax=Streptomyces sp. NPDC004539 TaxID=3154280 RepID=UPI0033B59AC5